MARKRAARKATAAPHCPLCECQFTDIRYPVVAPQCGHSLCVDCAFGDRRNTNVCVTCGSESFFGPRERCFRLSRTGRGRSPEPCPSCAWKRNYALLDLIDSDNEPSKPTVRGRATGRNGSDGQPSFTATREKRKRGVKTVRQLPEATREDEHSEIQTTELCDANSTQMPETDSERECAVKNPEMPNTERVSVVKNPEMPNTERVCVVKNAEMPNTERVCIVKNPEMPKTERMCVVKNPEMPNTQRVCVVKNPEIPNTEIFEPQIECAVKNEETDDNAVIWSDGMTANGVPLFGNFISPDADSWISHVHGTPVGHHWSVSQPSYAAEQEKQKLASSQFPETARKEKSAEKQTSERVCVVKEDLTNAASATWSGRSGEATKDVPSVDYQTDMHEFHPYLEAVSRPKSNQVDLRHVKDPGGMEQKEYQAGLGYMNQHLEHKKDHGHQGHKKNIAVLGHEKGEGGGMEHEKVLAGMGQMFATSARVGIAEQKEELEKKFAEQLQREKNLEQAMMRATRKMQHEKAAREQAEREKQRLADELAEWKEKKCGEGLINAIDYMACGHCKTNEKRERMKICGTCARLYGVILKGAEESKILPLIICAFCAQEHHIQHKILSYVTWKVESNLNSAVSRAEKSVTNMDQMLSENIEQRYSGFEEWKQQMEAFRRVPEKTSFEVCALLENALNDEAVSIVGAREEALRSVNKAIKKSSDRLKLLASEMKDNKTNEMHTQEPPKKKKKKKKSVWDD